MHAFDRQTDSFFIARKKWCLIIVEQSFFLFYMYAAGIRQLCHLWHIVGLSWAWPNASDPKTPYS